LTRLFFYYVIPFTMYLVAREVPVSPTAIRRTFVAFSVFGVYLGITTVAEMTGRYGLVFPRYIASPEYAEFLGRGRGPVLNPSGNGVLLSTCLFALWMLWPSARLMERTWIVGGSTILFAGIAATLTRCVWMETGLGGLTVLSCMLPRSYRKPMAIGIIAMASLAVAANWQNLNAFKRDKNVSLADMKKSAGLRPVLAYVAWQMVWDRPWFGVGLGHYKEWDKYYLADRSTDLVLETVRTYHQHNVFLSLLTETGLVGMTLYTAMLVLWSLLAWRLWQEPQRADEYRQLGLLWLASLLAYLVHGTFQDVTIIPMIHNVMFCLAGLMVGRALSPLSTDLNEKTRMALLGTSRSVEPFREVCGWTEPGSRVGVRSTSSGPAL